MKRNKGETLIELVMTIVIVGIMASAFVGLFLPQITLFFFLPNSVRAQNAASDAMASVIEGDRFAKGLRYAEPDKLSKITETVGITAANGDSVTYTYFDVNRTKHTVLVYLDTASLSLKRQIDGGAIQVLSSGGAPGTGGIQIMGEADVNTLFKYYNLTGTELTGAALTPLSIYYVTVGFTAGTGAGGVKSYQSQTLQKSGVKIRHFYLKNTGEWEFQFAKWNADAKPDLIAIKKNVTGSGRTQTHIYDGNSAFTAGLFGTNTILEETGDNFDFLMADCGNAGGRTPDGIQDLVAIKKSLTPSGKVEIHVYNGADGFQTPIFETAVGPVTALTPGPSNDVLNSYEELEFQMADWKPQVGGGDGKMDLFVIHKRSASGKTEVSVLDASVLSGEPGNFQKYFSNGSNLIVGSPPNELGPTDNRWTFQIIDWDADGYVDLAAIRKRGTASGKVEVYVYSGMPILAPSPPNPPDVYFRFQNALLLSSSTLPVQTASNLDFRLVDWDEHVDADGRKHPELIWVQRSQTGANKTEVHALSVYDAGGNMILVGGTAVFSRAVLDTATILHETNNGKSLTVP